ncbi:MAG: S41 family peptidase [Pseudobacter sp.]|uniref:S41 family peptidase n=1 Tax=Pseudobacter sp. TaxID=2045420 RepID=UPI003F7FCF3C
MIKRSTNLSSYIVVLLIAVCSYSCTKETGAVPDPKPVNFSEVFDQFWNSMNTRYVFWKEDTTDWDAMRIKYKPIFDQLDLYKAADLRKSVNYFREMTAGLTDAHYYITFTHPLLKDSTVYPPLDKKRSSPYYHNPFNYSQLVTGKLDAGYMVGTDNVTDPTRRVTGIFGTFNNNVLYFSCNNFYLYDAFTSAKANPLKPVLQYFFAQLELSPSPYKGIIIDLRGNGGGDISDLNFLMGRFITSPMAFGSTRYKTGAGRLDYTPWLSSNVTPVANSKGVTIPVIALADNFSASLAESVTMAIRQTPNGYFIGEPTWGANGPYAFNEQLYNAGPFELEGFMKVQTSSAAFRDINGNFLEGEGIMPDLFVPFDRASLQAGQDHALRLAIERLK